MRSVAGPPPASTRNSPSIPATRGPAPGCSRRGLLNPLVNEKRRGSATSVDSQFPVDPRYAGPRAGLLAPLVRLLPIRAAADVNHQWHTKLGDAGHPQCQLGFEAGEMIHRSFEHQFVVNLQDQFGAHRLT